MRRLVLIFALTLFSVAPATSEACQGIFNRGLDPGESAKNPIMRAPNGQAYAWSEGIMEEAPVVFHSRVILATEPGGYQETLFQSHRTADGRLLRFGREPSDHLYGCVSAKPRMRQLSPRGSLGYSSRISWLLTIAVSI